MLIELRLTRSLAVDTALADGNPGGRGGRVSAARYVMVIALLAACGFESGEGMPCPFVVCPTVDAAPNPTPDACVGAACNTTCGPDLRPPGDPGCPT